MLNGIEALIALERCGTVSEAALSLRLTQSAVTKRIQALQNDLGFRLTLPDGRRLRLTLEAKSYLEKAQPLLIELMNLSTNPVTQTDLELTLAMSDSIAASWGPAALRNVLSETPSLKVQVHAHRSALVLEAVRMGRYQVGLCTVKKTNAADLIIYSVASEPFVFVHCSLKNKFDKHLPLITIETCSATWPVIEPQIKDQSGFRDANFSRVETFSAAFQLVAAGFGNGLLPLGLVKSMNVKRSSYRLVPGVEREISLITRKNLSQQKAFQNFLHSLKKHCRNI